MYIPASSARGKNTLTHWLPELFAKKAYLGNFGDLRLDMGQISSSLLKRHLQHDSSPLFPPSSGFTKLLLGHVRNWPTSLGFSFLLFLFFWPSLFLLFVSFCCSDLPSTELASRSKTSEKASTGNCCHRVATCSGRKCCSEFFTEISEHFRAYFKLHWAVHSDLGIIGKTFSSEVEYRWCQF